MIKPSLCIWDYISPGLKDSRVPRSKDPCPKSVADSCFKRSRERGKMKKIPIQRNLGINVTNNNYITSKDCDKMIKLMCLCTSDGFEIGAAQRLLSFFLFFFFPTHSLRSFLALSWCLALPISNLHSHFIEK